MNHIPAELGEYFKIEDFKNYPIVEIPQVFSDLRGDIINIADGNLGDVALIKSNPGSTRANHYHREDWHLSYLLNGKLRYYWKNVSPSENANIIEVEEGSMIFTPKLVAHKMEFVTQTSLIVISKLSRIRQNYDNDLVRFAEI